MVFILILGVDRGNGRIHRTPEYQLGEKKMIEIVVLMTMAWIMGTVTGFFLGAMFI